MSRPERKAEESGLPRRPQGGYQVDTAVNLAPTTWRGSIPYVAVRAACGATGIDIGHGLCLIVSAQDNELFVDKINTAGTPANMPVLPSPDEVNGARAAVASMSRIATPPWSSNG